MHIVTNPVVLESGVTLFTLSFSRIDLCAVVVVTLQTETISYIVEYQSHSPERMEYRLRSNYFQMRECVSNPPEKCTSFTFCKCPSPQKNALDIYSERLRQEIMNCTVSRAPEGSGFHPGLLNRRIPGPHPRST